MFIYDYFFITFNIIFTQFIVSPIYIFGFKWAIKFKYWIKILNIYLRIVNQSVFYKIFELFLFEFSYLFPHTCA